MRRLFMLSLATMAIAAASPSVASAQYWDFQGTLNDPPTAPYQYTESNPVFNGTWWIRLSRANCEAKMILHHDATGSWLTHSIPGGCANLDYSHPYPAAEYDASGARNTEQGTGTVFVNVRVASAV